MACYSPLSGYKARHVSPSGKRAVVFSVHQGFADLPVRVPCGQCIGCRLERSRQWAVRCMHEASLYDDNCFVTLTYDDEHLPSLGSLDKSAFQRFLKRLRFRFDDRRIRFFSCGEYGAWFGRPHYHAILFNFDFPDKFFVTTRSGLPVYRSGILEELWPDGLSEIGSVTFESVAYVARYVMKKVTGSETAKAARYDVVDPSTGEVSRLVAEYATMSRKPGIGKPWLDKFCCEVFPSDGVVMRGRLMKPPRFYDLQYELVDAVEMEAVRKVRRRKRNRADETDERLLVRQAVAEARANLSVRRLP